MWHVAIQWSLGTDENVRGLAGIPGTTYGNRGDKSLRTVAWVGENTLFITGKTSKSMLGRYSPSLREVGGKGWAAACELEAHLLPRSCFCRCFCKNRFGLKTWDLHGHGGVLSALWYRHRDLPANILGSLVGRIGGQERSRSCDFDEEFGSPGNLNTSIFFLCETVRKHMHGKHTSFLCWT